MKTLSFFDRLIVALDQTLRVCTHTTTPADRPLPGDDAPEYTWQNPQQQKHIAALFRINHAGEIAAQGLYHGQALTATQSQIQQQMTQAANEENDHLLWCETRVKQLDSHISYLTPCWYVGAFIIGATAGIIGDKWSLGFVVETEKQVRTHLQTHIDQIPAADQKSLQLLKTMQNDEQKHESDARHAGANELPHWVKALMKHAAKVMTTLTYRI